MGSPPTNRADLWLLLGCVWVVAWHFLHRPLLTIHIWSDLIAPQPAVDAASAAMNDVAKLEHAVTGKHYGTNPYDYLRDATHAAGLARQTDVLFRHKPPTRSLMDPARGTPSQCILDGSRRINPRTGS